MNIRSLQINDENIISWVNESYYMYVPDLISDQVSKIKVKVSIDSIYKNMYPNKTKLLEFIDNIVLNSSIQKVPIYWDIHKERYYININSNIRKYKIYVHIYIDTVQYASNKRKVLSIC